MRLRDAARPPLGRLGDRGLLVRDVQRLHVAHGAVCVAAMHVAAKCVAAKRVAAMRVTAVRVAAKCVAAMRVAAMRVAALDTLGAAILLQFADESTRAFQLYALFF